jgi:hypothetical protein
MSEAYGKFFRECILHRKNHLRLFVKPSEETTGLTTVSIAKEDNLTADCHIVTRRKEPKAKSLGRAPAVPHLSPLGCDFGFAIPAPKGR